jgi:hypothetical protein
MNHKVSSRVVHFWNCVHWYVEQEYPDYFKQFIPDILPFGDKSTDEYKQANAHFNKLWDMMYGFYLGGNGAEDTARYMVDYLKGQKDAQ